MLAIEKRNSQPSSMFYGFNLLVTHKKNASIIALKKHCFPRAGINLIYFGFDIQPQRVLTTAMLFQPQLS